MKFMKLNLVSLGIILLLSSNIFPYERIILLTPAAGDIFKKLKLEEKVVGITRHMKGFKNAVKVGSHLKPNIEIMSSLKPDLVIISSTKFFSNAMKKYIKADFIEYNPFTLNQIIRKIKEFGKLLKKEKESEILIKSLNKKLKNICLPKVRPKVIYEVMQIPYIVSGKKDIINDIIETAGGKNIVKTNI